MTVEADRAGIDFDLDRKELVLQLHNVHFERGTATGRLRNKTFRFPIPDQETKRRIPRELTIQQLENELIWLDREREKLERERVLRVTLALSTGDFEAFMRPEFLHYEYQMEQHKDRYNKVRTEIHSRFALSCSCFFFVLLGTPFSIWQARRQFLMTFALCFFPVLICYYPIVIGSITLCKKHGEIHPAMLMWIGNSLLTLVGLWVLYRVRRC